LIGEMWTHIRVWRYELEGGSLFGMGVGGRVGGRGAGEVSLCGRVWGVVVRLAAFQKIGPAAAVTRERKRRRRGVDVVRSWET